MSSGRVCPIKACWYSRAIDQTIAIFADLLYQQWLEDYFTAFRKVK